MADGEDLAAPPIIVRPPMQLEDHPAYNMPPATQNHNGTELPLSMTVSGNQMLSDRAQFSRAAKIGKRVKGERI